MAEERKERQRQTTSEDQGAGGSAAQPPLPSPQAQIRDAATGTKGEAGGDGEQEEGEEASSMASDIAHAVIEISSVSSEDSDEQTRGPLIPALQENSMRKVLLMWADDETTRTLFYAPAGTRLQQLVDCWRLMHVGWAGWITVSSKCGSSEMHYHKSIHTLAQEGFTTFKVMQDMTVEDCTYCCTYPAFTGIPGNPVSQHIEGDHIFPVRLDLSGIDVKQEASGRTIVWVVAQTMLNDVDQWLKQIMPTLGLRQLKRLWQEHQFRYWAGGIELENKQLLMQKGTIQLQWQHAGAHAIKRCRGRGHGK